MKKAITLIILLFISTGLWADGKFILTTQVNNEIDDLLKEEIGTFIEEYIACLREDRVNDSLEYMSPVLLSANQNYNEVAVSLKNMFENNKFYLANEYYSKVMAKDDPIDLTIIPSGRETKFIINSLRIYGKETYNLFMLTEDNMPQYLLFISLGKFEDVWKINIIRTGLYGYRDNNAYELYKNIIESEDNNEMLSAAVYSIALSKILRPIEYLQYDKEKEYTECINRVINKVNDSKILPMTLSNISIFGINIEILNEYGIVPAIMYITDCELDDNAKDEAELLNKEILDNLGSLKDEFRYFIFKAYNDMPIDPNKQYKLYTTFIDKDSR